MEQTDARFGSRVLTSDVWWSLIVGLITLVGGVARSQPKLTGDQAVFISIFDAVAAGDRLYVDIFDHKDPVFFWLGGLEYRLLGIYGPFIAEVVLLAVFAVAVMWMGMYRSLPAWLAGAIGTGSAAFLVRSWFYDGLSTSVLGLTLVAVGAALTMGDRPRGAGVVFATVLFAKMSFAPLFLPFVLAGAFRYGRSSLVRGVTAGASTAAVWVLVLVVRGELSGFVETIRFNMSYSRYLQARGQRWEGTGLWGRMRLLGETVEPATTIAVTMVLVALGAAVIGVLTFRNGRRSVAADPFSLVGVGLVIATALILATSFLWTAHLQVLALSFALITIELTRLAMSRSISGVAAPVMMIGLFCLAALAIWPTTRDLSALRNTTDRWSIEEPEAAVDVEATLAGLQPDGPIEFAIVNGQLRALLPFLDDRFSLACPDFSQHNWWGDRLVDNVECVDLHADFVVRLDRTSNSPLQSGLSDLADLIEEDFDIRLDHELDDGLRVRIYELKERSSSE